MQTRRSFLKVAAAGACGAQFDTFALLDRLPPVASGVAPARYLGQPAGYWLSRLGMDDDEHPLPSLALEEFGAPVVGDVLQILERSGDSDQKIHSRAIRLLLYIGRPADWAVEQILFPSNAGWHDSRQVCQAAVGCLFIATRRQDGKGLDWLLRVLLDPDPVIRQKAVKGLGTSGGEPDLGVQRTIITALTSRLNDPSPEVAKSAGSCLTRLAVSTELLLELLRHSSAGVRVRAARRLLYEKRGDQKTLEEVVMRGLIDADSDCRIEAMVEVRAMPQVHFRALPVAIQLLRDDDCIVREFAVDLVSKLTKDNLAAELTEVFLHDADVGVSMTAGKAIHSAAKILPEAGLHRWLFHAEPLMRSRAYVRLSSFGNLPPDAYLWLAEAGMRDADQWVRVEAIRFASQFGGQAFDLLESETRDPCVRVRRRAAEGLGAWDKVALSGTPPLRVLLEDKAADVRVAAASAVLRLHIGDLHAKQVLKNEIYSADYWTRIEAASNLVEADPGNAVILLAAMAADHPQTRSTAAHGLGEAMLKLEGRMRHQVRRALAIAVNDEDLAVRAQAREALRR